MDKKEDCRIKNRRCLGICCFNFPERPTIYYRHGQSPMCKVWKTQPICQGHFWLRAKRNPLLLLLFDLGIPECMFTHFKNSLLDKIVMLHTSTRQHNGFWLVVYVCFALFRIFLNQLHNRDEIMVFENETILSNVAMIKAKQMRYIFLPEH